MANDAGYPNHSMTFFLHLDRFNSTNHSYLKTGSKGAFFLTSVIILLLIELIGIVGNILLCRVMVRSRAINRSYGLFLITLAVSDTLSIIMKMINTADELCEFRGGVYILHPDDVSCKLQDYCESFFTTLSAWLLVCITCERFLVVFYPLRGRMWWKAHRLTVFVVVLVVLALAQAPRLFFVEREPQKGYCRFQLTGDNAEVKAVMFDSLALFMFVYGLPGSLMLILNILIILRMRGILKHSTAARLEEYRQRYPMASGTFLNTSDSSGGVNTTSISLPCSGAPLAPPSVGASTLRDRQRATCILVAISTTYLVCKAPESIYQIYWAMVTASPQMMSRHLTQFALYYNKLRFVFQTFTAISYGSNFYTYFIFGKRFRAEVTRFLGSSSDGPPQHFYNNHNNHNHLQQRQQQHHIQLPTQSKHFKKLIFKRPLTFGRNRSRSCNPMKMRYKRNDYCEVVNINGISARHM